MNKNIINILGAATIVLATACNHTEENKPGVGIEISNIDSTAKPTDDFYQFVNGKWVINNPVPESESRWGSFNELYEKNMAKLKDILEGAANDKNAKAGTNTQKIGDFYSLAMDSAKLNMEGATPLKNEFASIDAIKTTDDIVKAVAHLHTIGVGPMFSGYIGQDAKVSTEYITQFFQGGIGMPDRDYYLKTEERFVGIQKAYVAHIAKMFELLGDKKEVAEKNAKLIYAIETNLAKASMSRVEMRDPEKTYHKKTVKELSALTPNLNWAAYLESAGVTGIENVIIGQPDFFVALNSELKRVSVNDWKIYLRWHLIDASANKLSDNFVNEHFDFYGKTLLGTPALKLRWKRSLEATDKSLGDALGQIFVEKHFPEDSKKRVDVMVDNLTASYEERIKKLDWMSEETKKQALDKLHKIMRKIGYPDKWKDYSSLDIKRDSYIQNFFRSNNYMFKDMVAKLGKPVDKLEWLMTTPTINAYYNSSLNEIVFPAGIMQPIFFNPDADDAVNYGCMGAIIGHELTHGFDDEGSQFDGDGNLKNWWSEEDKNKFKAKTDVLIKQFNDCVAIDDLHVNGELTLGENIADLGGLTIAYYALKKSMEGKPAAGKIDGFTPEQRFFMSWAQGWRINMRDAYLRNMIQTNPHSPGNFRANVPLSNMPEFYDAFGVKEGDKMFRPKADRAEIW